MRILTTIFLFIVLTSKFESEKYTYNVSHFSESLELFENNRFEYYAKIHMMGKMEIEGSYHIINDTLYLNSIPQHDKLIAKEDFNKKRKKSNQFNVRAKDNSLLTYHLYVELENGKQLVFRDQFEKTIFQREKIKSFYIIDTKGLKSPKYQIIGLNTNFFIVMFETKRVFENESWHLKGDYIRPKGLDGTFQKYTLNRTN